MTAEVQIKLTGNASILVNGAPFVSTPVLNWQENIETTIFGGSSDPEKAAYPPYATIDDHVLGCSLPFRFTGSRPKLTVRNRANGKQVIVDILDVGPWMTTDDYWTRNDRPMAEVYHGLQRPLPSGPNAGKVPTNNAGLDLTPAAAKAIGLDGKGYCDFVVTA